MNISSKVFKIAHKATKTSFSKGKFANKTYAQVFKSKLKWAWKTVKSEAQVLTVEVLDRAAGIINSILKETAKAVCFEYTRRNHTVVQIWMPKSAFGTEWGLDMLDRKIEEVGR